MTSEREADPLISNISRVTAKLRCYSSQLFFRSGLTLFSDSEEMRGFAYTIWRVNTQYLQVL
jgi:hypothetical protein